METSFFEIKKIHGHFELFLNKKLGGKRHSLLMERSKSPGTLGLSSLIQKCELNGEFRHLQKNAKNF